jgi:predicted nucleotidyltransferase
MVTTCGILVCEGTLEELLARRVELVTPESLSPYIRPHVMNEVEYAVVAP